MKLIAIIIVLLFTQNFTSFSQQRVSVITIPKNSLGDVKRYFTSMLMRTVQTPSKPVGLIEARNKFWNRSSFMLSSESGKYFFTIKDTTNKTLLTVPLFAEEGSINFSSNVILSEVISMDKKEQLIRNFLAFPPTPLSFFEMTLLATILLENKIISYQP